MNLSRIRKKFDVRQGVEWLTRYWVYVRQPGQDWMNSCFRGDIKLIEDRFNNRSTGFCDDIHAENVANSILHATPAKPWAELKGSTVDRLYWRAFLKTPWGRLQSGEIIDLMIDIVEKSPFTHHRTAQCYGKIFHRLWMDIFLYNDVFQSAVLFFKALFYEAKYLFTQRKSETI